jgi:hypothetical protein
MQNTHKSILQDGTIGSELVIRPLPVKHRKLQQKSAGVQLQSGSHDDEMFMDEEDFRSADFMTPSPPSTLPPANDTENALIRKKRSFYDLKHSVGSHIVYKRAAIQSEDDYGMRYCFFFFFILMLFPFYCYVVHRDIQRALECSFNESTRGLQWGSETKRFRSFLVHPTQSLAHLVDHLLFIIYGGFFYFFHYSFLREEESID